MQPITVDSSNWPIVVSVFDGSQSTADIERYIAQTDALYDRREPFLAVSVMRRWTPSRAHLDRITGWLAATEPRVRAYCVCNGIVATSAAFRFLLSSLFLVRPMPVPYRVCATLEEAVGFAREHGARRGVTVPRALQWSADIASAARG